MEFPMTITSIDHVALPILRVEQMLEFYESLGFKIDRSLKPELYSAQLHDQKINFHSPSLWKNTDFTLRAPNAMPGCGDLCLVWSGSLLSLKRHMEAVALAVLEGPVSRRGGRDLGETEGTSVYTRDPDGNLVEFICYPCAG